MLPDALSPNPADGRPRPGLPYHRWVLILYLVSVLNPIGFGAFLYSLVALASLIFKNLSSEKSFITWLEISWFANPLLWVGIHQLAVGNLRGAAWLGSIALVL